MDPNAAAFPSQYTDSSGNPQMPGDGLTKREYFAIKCMQGVISDPHSSGNYQLMSEDAVKYAYALIKALSAE